MADEPVTNGQDGEVEDLPLQTIDLGRKISQQGQQQPVLEFSQNTTGMEAPPPVATQVDGTELQRRTRARSGGHGVNLKEWGTHQFKITKQMVQERFGSGLRTVDTELEKRIESLRDTQKKYAQLMYLAQQFQTSFVTVVETQKSMAEHFAFMSIRAPELTTQFHYNSETQKVISRNGETLLAAVKHFTSNMQTVSTKTMDDTLQTVKVYESARVSYDAYRTECESLRKQASTSQRASNNLAAVSAEFEKHKKKFEQLRQDVDIKLKLLDENKIRVAHKQLVLLQGAFAAYFSCNHEAVDAILEEFKEKLETIEENDTPAWLEDLPSQATQPSQS